MISVNFLPLGGILVASTAIKSALLMIPAGTEPYHTGETVLYAREGYTADLSISGNSSVAAMISYVATGESKTANGAFQTGTVTFCSNAVDKLT